MELPDGVQIENVEPSRIPIRLERLIEQTRDVKVNLEGQPAEGYEVRSIEITPARVRVRGPQSHIESLPNAPTETISLDGRRETFVEGQIAIDVQDQKIITLDPIVSVRVQIEEQRVERTFANVPVRLSDANNEIPIEPNQASITVRAPRSIAERLRGEDLTIILVRRDDGGFEPRLAFAIPEYSDRIELISTRPAQFSVGR